MTSIAAVLSAAMFFAAESPSRTVCPRRPENVPPPTMDGSLDDAAWNVAVRLKMVETETGNDPSVETYAYLLWDDANLYVAFSCADTDETPHATMTRRDDNLYEEEVVEVFIDSDGDGRVYEELEVNPLNALFDAIILNNGKGIRGMRDWQMEGIRHAAQFAPGKGWAVEMALPLKEFYTAPNIPPKVGEVWRMNLYRIERKGAGTPPELIAWSPTRNRNFHTPGAFGYVEFGDVPKQQE